EVPSFSYLPTYLGLPGVSAVKNLHTVQEMQETWVWSPTTTTIKHQTGLPVLCSNFSPAIQLTPDSEYTLTLFSSFISLSPSPTMSTSPFSTS
ncbi:unnamed protein product, partial [Rangifer tarandus platyrhynchus]